MGLCKWHKEEPHLQVFGAAVNYSLDRFATYHSSDGAFTISQETSVVPTDFTHALKILTTTADSSIAAGQRLIVFTRCEGNNVSHLNWGTSAAETVTLSFYVRSSITGTHGGAIGNGSDNRNYPFTYTISSADTWERKTITISGDQTGTWATGTGRSLQIVWGLGVGSTFSGSAGAWASGDINSATGATTGVLGTLNATWYLTGVQLEVGTVATPFEHRSVGQELALCQRYYYKKERLSYPAASIGHASAGTNLTVNVDFPVTMRSTPTLVIYDREGTSNSIINVGNNTLVGFTPSQVWWTEYGIASFTGTNSLSTSTQYGFNFTADIEL